MACLTVLLKNTNDLIVEGDSCIGCVKGPAKREDNEDQAKADVFHNFVPHSLRVCKTLILMHAAYVAGMTDGNKM